MEVLDHRALHAARVTERFKGKTKFLALLDAFAKQAQEVEDAYQQLYTLRNIALGTGDTLDQIGDVIGQPRNGLSDNDYKPYLYARVATNNSQGLVDDLIRIVRAIAADSDATIEVEQFAVATVVVRLLDPGTSYPASLFAAAISFLREAVAAGVRIIFEGAPYSDDETFFTPIFGLIQDFAAAGSIKLVMRELDGFRFPEFGTVQVDPGTASAETLDYYYRTHDTLFLSTATAQIHNPAAVSYVILTTPGDGFGKLTFTTDQTFRVNDDFNGNTDCTVPAGTYSRKQLEIAIEAELPAGGANWKFDLIGNIASFDELNGADFSVTWIAATQLRDALTYDADSGLVSSPYVAPSTLIYNDGGRLITALE